MNPIHHLLPVLILLLAGILSIALMRGLRLSPIIGFLVAGILIGEHGFGWVEESGTTHLMAELGVVFLLFDIGLHFPLSHLWDSRRDILGLGPLQVILSTLVFAVIALWFGFGMDIAIVIAATLTLSSTAVAVQVMADSHQQNCPIEVSATAVLIFQDICAIFLLILASSLGSDDGGLAQVMGLAALKAMVAFVAAIAIGRYLLAPTFGWMAAAHDSEIFTAAALLLVLATAAATGSFGLSMTLGAFLAGMIISETPYKMAIHTEVKPFRGLLLGFFFITVGMALETQTILEQWWLILLVSLGLILLKALLIFASARVFRVPSLNALQMSVLLAQGSEFAFVIFAMPTVQASLPEPYPSILITAVAASMALTPLLVKLERRVVERIIERHWQEEIRADHPVEEKPYDIIIIGMAESGRRVASALETHNLKYHAIEIDHDHFVDAIAQGFDVGFGDATDRKLLDTIRVAHVHSIVLSFADYAVAAELARLVHEHHPDVELLVSVHDEHEQKRFADLGMTAVIDAVELPGMLLATKVLEHYQVPGHTIEAWAKRQQTFHIEHEKEEVDLLNDSALQR
jgi:CPA2 family monovalent cation:H+ antiporter-2